MQRALSSVRRCVSLRLLLAQLLQPPHQRIVARLPAPRAHAVCCVAPQDKESGGELEVQEKQPLLEWLANNYKKFGCALEFITNK